MEDEDEQNQQEENSERIDNDNDKESGHDHINGDNSSTPASFSLKKRLIDDVKLQAHSEAIEAPKAASADKHGNDEGQYQLMTASNKFLVTVQNELHRAHQDLITAYSPELSQNGPLA